MSRASFFLNQGALESPTEVPHVVGSFFLAISMSFAKSLSYQGTIVGEFSYHHPLNPKNPLDHLKEA